MDRMFRISIALAIAFAASGFATATQAMTRDENALLPFCVEGVAEACCPVAVTADAMIRGQRCDSNTTSSRSQRSQTQTPRETPPTEEPIF